MWTGIQEVVAGVDLLEVSRLKVPVEVPKVDRSELTGCSGNL